MKWSIILLSALALLVYGCAAATLTPNIEATVQAAIEQTTVAITTQTASSPQRGFEENLGAIEVKLSSLCWVAYAPTHFDPTKGVFPSEDDIREDLQTLYGAGFRGLVTYGSDAIFREIPRVAGEVGFEGVIMGVWSPTSTEEITNAKEVAGYVDGYCVGNEGLFFGRYDFDTLESAMDDLRAATEKPVATTEVLDGYYNDPAIRDLGDWAFPNVHPYWNGIKEPQQAVTWTQQQFEDLSDLYEGSSKMLIFKEVGLPTDGDPEVSEEGQAEYYDLLKRTNAKFFYFEAFDQSWKGGSVEPHWGLFRSDRSPKPVVDYVCITILFLPLILKSWLGG